METNYTVDYFIKKFEAIPERLWSTGQLTIGNGVSCALGHCDGYDSDESVALAKLIIPLYLRSSFYLPQSCGITDLMGVVYYINDGLSEFKNFGESPKQRILAALYDIKSMQEKTEQPKWKDITSELAVFPVEEKSDLVTVKEIV